MASKEDKFDGIFLSVAQQHEGGIPDLMDTFFSFLRRKTDFYTGGEKAKEMLMKAYNTNEQKALEDERKKKKGEDERRERQRKQEEEEAKKPRVEEITDEEEQEILNQQKKKAASSKEEIEDKKSSEIKTITSKTDDEDDGKLLPNAGNGSQTDKYSWTQVLQELEVRIPVPPGTRGKDIDMVITADHMRLGIKGKAPIIDDEFEKPVKPAEKYWTLDDNKLIILTLSKLNQMEWWSRLLKKEEEISTRKITPETSKLEDLDGETRGTVEKMMFDTRQKSMGLPTSDDMQNNDMIKKFMAQHPEMDFSKAKYS